MAPTALRKMIALQTSREAEMDSIRTRLQNKSRDSLNKNIVQSRLDGVKEIWAQTRKTHAEIISREGAETEAYVADKWFDRIQGVYENAVDEFLTLLAHFDRIDADVSLLSEPVSEAHVAKLPRLPLPKFSGRYEDWSSFSDLFTTLVHDVPHLSDATKLQYLKLCLTGAAAELIKDVTTTNANYSSTWQALSFRYHNPRLIINKLLTSLMEIPHLKRESSSDLRAFIDDSQRIIRALTNLKLPVEQWDVWLIFLLSDRLDPESRKQWEAELSTKDMEASVEENESTSISVCSFPKLVDFTRFLEKRAQALSMIVAERKPEKRPAATPSSMPHSKRVFYATPARLSGASKCPLCSGTHSLSKCFKLKNRSPHERLATIKRLQVCFNCFGSHRAHACTSAGRCSICRGKHHSLLHPKSQGNSQAVQQDRNCSPADETNEKTSVVSLHAATVMTTSRQVILATPRVKIIGPGGYRTYARALIDQGSEVSFVSESIVQILGLQKESTHVCLTGLGASSAGTARSMTQLILSSSKNSNFKIKTNALILPRLTSQLPAENIIDIDVEQFRGLDLADPQFYMADKIDVILGADVHGSLLRSGLKRFPQAHIVAQNTIFGWIISGPLQVEQSRRAAEVFGHTMKQTAHCVPLPDLDQTLQRFWALEDFPMPSSTLRPDEGACEKLFMETHVRDLEGRYEVRLPVKAPLPFIAAETCKTALGSLSSMHRRFTRDSKVAQAYVEFMEEYERLGHMQRIPPSEINLESAWYLPHHAVVRTSDPGLKIRVVFDASRRSRNGDCLNDFLLPGAPLQSDLALILLNWRRYMYVFTADIVKMFRQIRVNRADQDFQRIVWAPNAECEPVDYRLTTVTYGTTCAPYLAIRTLQQLAEDEKSKFPIGAECLKTEAYVDDIFAGSDDLYTAAQKRIELTKLLGSAGISLGKWAANHSELLPPATISGLDKQITSDNSIKTLGVQWSPTKDEFKFHFTDVAPLLEVSTKRSVLSNIARLFDPLGWLSPITVKAKIIMQDLWIQECEWDSPLPTELRERWIDYCRSLSELSAVKIDRWLGLTASCSCEIHGFSDASSRAYAAIIFLRIHDGNEQSRISLLTAKTKVAPVKTVSIPNLELCGAALLVRLICHVRKLDFLRSAPVFAWTDSQIVLTWLRKHPCSWKPFVANRVSFIHTELPCATWAHVPSKENPADLATRGSVPAELSKMDLWWRGPHWLSQPFGAWPQPAHIQRSLYCHKDTTEQEIVTRFSSLSHLIRIIAFCRRPLINLRRRRRGQETLPFFLSSSELTEARLVIIRLSQASSFEEEITMLKAGKRVPKNNRLSKLNPILGSDNVLRVGGRLANSNLTFDSKHPPILSKDSALSLLFVRSAHRLCLHGGPTLTSSILMRQVWILNKSKLVKSIIRKCIVCQRIKPHSAQQLMGDLPADRVKLERPFSTAGLDYAGPIQLRATKGPGYRSYKGYIAVFICFSTRAIHLELVSDLTAASFINAYRRFVGRRGISKKLFSDNATNFHAADKELKAMFHRASKFYREVGSVLANDGTEWQFIPPSAPHYGGLWEAGVRSVKHHLKRAVGEHTLTFEELSTVLVEIEACLNSRPLGALTADIDDLQVLTPFHFLHGSASALLPEDDSEQVPQNRLGRFQLLQRIRNQFWKRWSSEYLLHLQQREKWRDPSENFCIGRLVLVKDDRYPPSKWPLGRVIEVHPGPDGLVRVTTVKTATTSLRRHISRLCPLYIDDSNQQN